MVDYRNFKNLFFEILLVILFLLVVFLQLVVPLVVLLGVFLVVVRMLNFGSFIIGFPVFFFDFTLLVFTTTLDAWLIIAKFQLLCSKTKPVVCIEAWGFLTQLGRLDGIHLIYKITVIILHFL